MESDAGLESSVEETTGQDADALEDDIPSKEALSYSSDDHAQVQIAEVRKSGVNKEEKSDSLDGKIDSESNKLASLGNIIFEPAKSVWYHKSGVSEEETRPDEKEDTKRGAAAIIYNKETGEFYFELKPLKYPIKEARGKYALVGGKVEHTDKTSLDALIREIREEVVDKKAQEILIGKLTNLDTYYHTIVEFVSGVKYETDIYKINVDSYKEWNIVRNSSLAEGQKQVIAIQDLRNRLGDFAFKYEEALEKLFNEEYGTNSQHDGVHIIPLPIISNYANYTQRKILGSSTPRFGNQTIDLRIAA